MEDSLGIIEAACRGVRPARTPTFDLYQNDAVIEHFSGRKLDGTPADEEVVAAAIARSLDGTRHLGGPGVPGTTFVDEVGNEHIRARWTSWVKRHAYSSPEEWASYIPRHTETLRAKRAPTAAEQDAELARQAALSARLNGAMFIHCTPFTALNTLMFGYRWGLDTLPLLWADDRSTVTAWMPIGARVQRIPFWHAAHTTSPIAVPMFRKDNACRCSRAVKWKLHWTPADRMRRPRPPSSPWPCAARRVAETRLPTAGLSAQSGGSKLPEVGRAHHEQGILPPPSASQRRAGSARGRP